MYFYARCVNNKKVLTFYSLRYIIKKLSEQGIYIAGWSSLVARRAHNPKVVGSNPAPATSNNQRITLVIFFYTK